MSDTTIPPEDTGTEPLFDPTALTPEDAPEFTAPKPDHTASADPEDDAEPIAPTNVRPFVRSAKTRKDKSAKDKGPKPLPGEPGYVPPKRAGQLVTPLTNLYVSVGATVSAFDSVCGMTILDNAEKCAQSLDALAQRNEAIRRALFRMLETSAWGGVLAAHVPLLVMVMVHHGPPDVAQRLAPIAAFTAPNAMGAMAAEQAEGEAKRA